MPCCCRSPRRWDFSPTTSSHRYECRAPAPPHHTPAGLSPPPHHPQKAFECALLDSQELMHNYLEKVHAPLVPIEDCFMNPTSFKYPNLTVVCTLRPMTHW